MREELQIPHWKVALIGIGVFGLLLALFTLLDAALQNFLGEAIPPGLNIFMSASLALVFLQGLASIEEDIELAFMVKLLLRFTSAWFIAYLVFYSLGSLFGIAQLQLGAPFFGFAIGLASVGVFMLRLTLMLRKEEAGEN